MILQKNISSDIDERLVNGFYKRYVGAEIILMPTAYDVNKVIEELEEIAYVSEDVNSFVDLEDAIEIIKQGE